MAGAEAGEAGFQVLRGLAMEGEGQMHNLLIRSWLGSAQVS